VVARLTTEDAMSCRLLAPEDRRGHLAVIDPDTAQGQTLLAGLRPGQVKLLLTGSLVQTGKNVISLQRPVQAASLYQLLRRICRQMLEQLSLRSTAPPPVSEPALEANRPATAVAAPGLLPLLSRARHKQQVLQIGWDDQELFVDGSQQVYATLAPADRLQALLRAPLEKITVAKLAAGGFPARLNSTITALENLLWEAGLACDQELPQGFAPDCRLRLKAWPNFTRNGFHPEHIKIAALLAQRAVSYEELLHQPGLTASGICSFINACHAVELIINVATAEIPDKIHQPPTPERKGILNRIAQRLGIAFG